MIRRGSWRADSVGAGRRHGAVSSVCRQQATGWTVGSGRSEIIYRAGARGAGTPLGGRGVSSVMGLAVAGRARATVVSPSLWNSRSQ